jgi:two-component system LytT family response regulator
MIRVLIVDDESHACDELAALLAEQGEIELLGACNNAMEAIRVINREHPQILFLDIRMPVIDGFELLSMIDEDNMPFVVFVTAYDEFALKAFEEKTLDYLLKPIDPQRLAQTMKKVRAALFDQGTPRYQVSAISRIPCSHGHKIKLIDPAEIEYIHSDISGVHVYTATGGYFTELTLKVLEARAGLQRCHKQYLVNPALIDEIVPLENGLAQVKTCSQAVLPVSRRYLRALKGLFHL